ncbi:hypothetical protein Clacol_009889 [Clathrus columnatus]|uniref:Protein kinase domain-containing protein n=1 Tax=Clathrus columnatus TaxID=1419009 RepID=A0AAV5AS47_9AGAM|nr:hypothetical protein Clacol_009889 [Clathrus columnatus]
MVNWECLSISSQEDEENLRWDDSFCGNINLVDDGFSLTDYLLNAAEGESDDEGGYSYTPISQQHVQLAIENISQHADDILTPRVSCSPLHIPSISRSSRELSIWRFLNQPHLRRDPWNPAPPVLSIIEREVGLSASARFARLVEFGLEGESHEKEFEAFIALEPLYPIHDNPLSNRNDWIDFIRQMLQSLVFLHEHNIAQVKFSWCTENLTRAIMMDIGLAPPHTHFSRSDYPVKYYLVDFSEAIRLELQEPKREVRRGRPRNVVRLAASRSERLRSTSRSNARRILLPSDHISSGLSPYKEIRKCNSASTPVVAKLLDDISDPETDSGSEAFSSDEEDDSLRRVPMSIRSLAFGLDLKNLGDMLEKALPFTASVLFFHIVDLTNSLAYLLNSIRQGKLSAAAALDTFEKVVRLEVK